MSKTDKTHNTADNAETSQTLLQAFEGLGMFAARDAKPDTIQLPNGKVAQFYVRELTDAKFRKLFAEQDRSKLIAATICDADGKDVMTVAEAARLKPLVAKLFQDIAMKHSGFGDAAVEEQVEAGNE